MRLNEIQQPTTLWFRGIENAVPSRFINRSWARPSDDLPAEINALFSRTNRIHRLMNYPFTIRRTYEGMSNWGFGVYVTNNIDWAKRYGSTIIVCGVDTASILRIKHSDFLSGDESTPGGLLKKKLYAHSDMIREQAPIMYQVVKSIKRDAKALFVQTDEDGDGQMCVFSKQAISGKYTFDLDEPEGD